MVLSAKLYNGVLINRALVEACWDDRFGKPRTRELTDNPTTRMGRAELEPAEVTNLKFQFESILFGSCINLIDKSNCHKRYQVFSQLCLLITAC